MHVLSSFTPTFLSVSGLVSPVTSCPKPPRQVTDRIRKYEDGTVDEWPTTKDSEAENDGQTEKMTRTETERDLDYNKESTDNRHTTWSTTRNWTPRGTYEETRTYKSRRRVVKKMKHTCRLRSDRKVGEGDVCTCVCYTCVCTCMYVGV